MKRLIPASIVFTLVIALCFWAHTYINHACQETLDDIENFYNQSITSSELEKNWQERKENMALFVNHGFLDKISVYIGQLTVAKNDSSSHEINVVYKNIKSVLSLIEEEQKFALHSFY